MCVYYIIDIMYVCIMWYIYVRVYYMVYFSCWVRPFPSTVGVLVGKSSAAGVLYSLALVADDSNFLVRFTHRQSLAGQVLGVDMADIPVAMALLTDGTYHSVVMVVTGDRALLYIDGRFIDSRQVPARVFFRGAGHSPPPPPPLEDFVPPLEHFI